jgi:hypothetical protein
MSDCRCWKFLPFSLYWHSVIWFITQAPCKDSPRSYCFSLCLRSVAVRAYRHRRPALHLARLPASRLSLSTNPRSASDGQVRRIQPCKVTLRKLVLTLTHFQARHLRTLHTVFPPASPHFLSTHLGEMVSEATRLQSDGPPLRGSIRRIHFMKAILLCQSGLRASTLAAPLPIPCQWSLTR